jgi:hypothetical protein
MMSTAGILALAPAGTWAQTPANTSQHLEHLMIDNADTPAEHQALARYYRMKSADAKALAAEHRAMAKSYIGGNVASLRTMKKHCDRIAELNEELATQYEDLAKGEDAAAKM